MSFCTTCSAVKAGSASVKEDCCASARVLIVTIKRAQKIPIIAVFLSWRRVIQVPLLPYADGVEAFSVGSTEISESNCRSRGIAPETFPGLHLRSFRAMPHCETPAKVVLATLATAAATALA